MTKELYNNELAKAPTGIRGFDDITYGGLPRERTTLVSGYAGCGKTVFSMYFILNGIIEYNEPGVFLSIEENENDLITNFSSFGFDIEKLQQDNSLILDNINLSRPELQSAGTFDLTALFVRIEQSLKKNNAKRLVIDTFELLFHEINDPNVFRRELLRLINWLKKKKITAIFTSEATNHGISHYGLEEYITDCVVTLKNIKEENIYTRRLHILKYRGNFHGTNEYPFLIDKTGITLMPITNIKMPQYVSSDVLPCGISDLDKKLSKKGLYAGSSTLISGTSGVGKTSFGMSFCYENLQQGKSCLFFAFEESAAQLRRNMQSIGMDLEKYENTDQLWIVSDRPSISGIEMHLVSILKKVHDYAPDIVVFDPVTTLIEAGTLLEVRNMLLRLMDYFKAKNITVMLTTLISGAKPSANELGISSLVDNIISLENNIDRYETRHTLSIDKIRGMSYDHQVFQLVFTNHGLKIRLMNKPEKS
ncbi:MAG: circadian clock protein KaiC [Candidatus Cyclobacteriaceae bacterium M3_2C_046]